MCQQNDWCIVSNLRQRQRQVIDTLPKAPSVLPSWQERDLITQSGKPKALTIFHKSNRIVLVDRYSDLLQSQPSEDWAATSLLRCPVFPPIVIPEHCVNAQRCR